jgi:CBS domain-containing membrane protein
MTRTETDQSLALDLDQTGRGETARTVARVAVVGTVGFTRDGSDATVTIDCGSAAALEREVERLHRELDEALEQGRVALGAKARAGAGSRTKAARRADETEHKRPQVSVPFSVADLMTRAVRTVAPNDSLASAKAAMDSGGFRHLVVVDEDGDIEGVLSHRDLFFGPLAWSIGQGLAAYEKLLNTSRVKDVMHADVATIDASAALQEAAALMRERKIGCLPVVDGERLVGLVTEGDFVDLVAEASR